jgi:hypothetical protein
MYQLACLRAEHFSELFHPRRIVGKSPCCMFSRACFFTGEKDHTGLGALKLPYTVT